MLGNRGQKGWLRLQVLPCRPGPGCQAGQEGPVQGHPQGSPEHIGPEEKGGATVYSSWPSPSSGSTENMRQRDRGAVARVRDAFPLSSALRVWSPLQGQGQTLLPQPLLSACSLSQLWHEIGHQDPPGCFLIIAQICLLSVPPLPF